MFTKWNKLTITKFQALGDALNNIYDAKVPEVWLRGSWVASTLGFWFTELLERDKQFRTWCFQGRPTSFWMAGFFNPQGELHYYSQTKIFYKIKCLYYAIWWWTMFTETMSEFTYPIYSGKIAIQWTHSLIRQTLIYRIMFTILNFQWYYKMLWVYFKTKKSVFYCNLKYDSEKM